MQDAINRAKAYIDYGADAILIHSRKKLLKKYLSFQNNTLRKD